MLTVLFFQKLRRNTTMTSRIIALAFILFLAVLIILAIGRKYFFVQGTVWFDVRDPKDWSDPTVIEASVSNLGNYIADDYDEAVAPYNPDFKNYEYRETLRQIKLNKYYSYQINFTDHVDNCVKLFRAVGYTVCPRRNDFMAHIARVLGFYELGHTWNTLRLLRKTPGAAFIDVGANIGLQTMPAANILANDNRLIIAVEPFPANMRHLAYAARLNNINLDHLVLINRCMYNTSDLTFTMLEDKGSSNVRMPETMGKPKLDIPFSPEFQLISRAKTATFDSHILPILKAAGISTAIVKLDIEGNECTALAASGTEKFFAEINVPYITMEWGWYYVMMNMFGAHGLPTKSCAMTMVNRLRKLSYFPFSSTSKGLSLALPIDDPFNWPASNVLWKKIL